ncbi:VanZ family protein [Microbacterium sp.]|uniref:VanZ family protein n=1 Tax=Microbacterium sp. TaxID=51671 RepID=UPI002810FE14|nr:VanZ family protein [Microbacterium sp.]
MSDITLGPRPPRSYARLWIATFLLLIYTAFVLLITMWPNPGQLEVGGISERVLRVLWRLGVPEWFDFAMLEFTANIAMFVPLGSLLGLALPRRGWWLALFLLPAFSGFIEVTQGTLLPERFSTVSDVVANTAGGYVGLLLATIMRALLHARDQRVIEREIWERNAAYLRARAELRARNQAEPADLATQVLEPGFWTDPRGEAPTLRLPIGR